MITTINNQLTDQVKDVTMRNLKQYPITYDEKVNWLNDQRKMLVEEAKSIPIIYGDIRVVLIDDILEDLWRLNDLMD